MNTFTTSQDQEFTIDYSSSSFSGYGHQKITVYVIADNGDKKSFYHTTDDMPGFDKAMDLEGQEKYEALFELVETSLDGEISEWISEIND